MAGANSLLGIRSWAWLFLRSSGSLDAISRFLFSVNFPFKLGLKVTSILCYKLVSQICK